MIGNVKHSQIVQNSKFAMSLQYLKKEFRNEVDFLHADKYQSSLQLDFNPLAMTISCKMILSLLMGMIKNSQSTQSITSLQYLKDI